MVFVKGGVGQCGVNVFSVAVSLRISLCVLHLCGRAWCSVWRAGPWVAAVHGAWMWLVRQRRWCMFSSVPIAFGPWGAWSLCPLPRGTILGCVLVISYFGPVLLGILGVAVQCRSLPASIHTALRLHTRMAHVRGTLCVL